MDSKRKQKSLISCTCIVIIDNLTYSLTYNNFFYLDFYYGHYVISRRSNVMVLFVDFPINVCKSF